MSHKQFKTGLGADDQRHACSLRPTFMWRENHRRRTMWRRSGNISTSEGQASAWHGRKNIAISRHLHPRLSKSTIVGSIPIPSVLNAPVKFHNNPDPASPTLTDKSRSSLPFELENPMLLPCASFSRLHAYLVFAQLCFAGFEILSRSALNGGSHPLAFTFYRNCVASLALGCLAFMTEKKRWQRQWPGFKTIFFVFALGFLGVTVNQVCYMIGLKFTSAIFASAMRNSAPVFTFVIAAIWRIEKVNLKRRDGQAKLLGALLGLCGSLLLAIYRGPVVIESNISVTNKASPRTSSTAKKSLHLFGKIHFSMAAWKIGAIVLVISCLAFAGFLILQSSFLDKHSMPISFAAFACFSSTIQIPLLGAIYERQWSSWKLSSSWEIFTILYAGLVASGLVSSIQSWGVLRGGPVIVAAYQPLETIFTALFSLVFLKEDLHLGSILGAALVILGLYLLIWGQKKEHAYEEPNGLPIDTALNTLELYPHHVPVALRRHSCDLETRRKSETRTSARRHSTSCNDLPEQQQQQQQQQQQGPLRRLSSTFTTLLRSLEKKTASNHEEVENHQLLTGTAYSHDPL